MKFIKILIVCLFFISCKAQTVPLNTYYHNVSSGAYFKDTLGELDKFDGTWVYSNSNISLTIILKKKIHVYDGEYYEDIIVGEYKLIQNNQEIVNTLPTNLLDWDNIDDRNIGGRRFISSEEVVPCVSCDPNEKRLMLYFSDPQRKYLTSTILLLRYVQPTSGEPEKMIAKIVSTQGVIIPDENTPTEPRVPLGEYLMIKQ